MTETKNNLSRFETVLYALPERIVSILDNLPLFIKNSAFEIRLRVNRPLCITSEHTFYISEESEACSYLPSNPIIVTKEEIGEVIKRITDSSLYAREEELKEGFLSMNSGNRAGIGGNFVFGKLREVTSVNIRIAKEVKGCAKELAKESINGLLIVGAAGSGKTTLLRDLIRILSNEGHRVCAIDTRGELCGREGALDVGVNTDIITGLDKARASEIALRTLNPEYIAFDEVGNGGELTLIRESFFSGVKILATAHASDIGEIKSRGVTSALLDGSIGKIALINGGVGANIQIMTPKEVLSSA